MTKINIEKPEVIRRYAQAILAVASGEGLLEQVEEEMSLIREMLMGSSSLQQFLKNPQITSADKQKTIMEILKNKVSGVVLQQVALIILQKRGDLLRNIIDELFRLTAESRKQKIGRITTAISIPEPAQKRIEKALSDFFGTAILLKNSVDPSIIGGFILQIDDRIINASIEGQLGRIRGQILREIDLMGATKSSLRLEQAGDRTSPL
jgi:F-type H+-transporting ATPase subunit delta